MESWLSGRKHLTANEAGSKSPREFESRTLRNEQNQGMSLVLLYVGTDDGTRIL